MSTNTNQFLVSVCDVILRDKNTDQIVVKGKANINSALKQTLNSEEIRGGIGHGLLFVYNSQKKLEVSIEAATFDEQWIAMNNGVLIENGIKEYYTEEQFSLIGGSGTVSQTPVGNVYVQKQDNSIVTITPNGKDFTLPNGGDSKVKVSYQYNTTVDSITIDSKSAPNAFECTLIANIFQASGKSAELQIVVPEYKLTGNFDLSFTSSGVSTNKMDGMALADEDGNYAVIKIKPVGNSTVSYIAIASNPAFATVTATSPTAQIQTYGLRGGNYANVLFPTSECTYVSSTPATATVSPTGLVTQVANGDTVITVTHTASGLKDTVNIKAAS